MLDPAEPFNWFLLLFCFAVGFVIAFFIFEMRFSDARSDAEKYKARYEAELESRELREKKYESMREEFRKIAMEVTRTEGDQVRREHASALASMLSPLGRDIAAFREQFLKGHADMNRYIKDLIDQTDTVSRGAEELARALRGNSKLQGNWGEAVLANLLSAAGLTEGRDFTLQERTKDDEGRELIPDVVVHLPGSRAVVIDSKVSLTAYTDFIATDEGDTARRAALLKEHVASVRRHIMELSKKKYDKVVKDSIGYVLMFIPGEAAYAAAVTADPHLTTDAYGRRVILLNPGNLLMALQLAYNLWQSEMQSRSVGEIYASADKLYHKFALFAQSFLSIGQGITRLAATYEKAEKQLASGRGNIVSQLEEWKKKGLTPSTDIPEALTGESETVLPAGKGGKEKKS